MSELNIVELIENHPISKLTCTYNVKLLDKIKTNFSDTEQQLFIGSFYCYLNYDTKKDFVVDLDNVWKWIGFSQKYNAERMLESLFVFDTDYKLFAPPIGGANAKSGISQKSLAKVLDKPIRYKEYYFKSLGEKLFM